MARWSDHEQEARLVDALAWQDNKALAGLYDLYAERLFDYCCSLLGTAGHAADAAAGTGADIVQDTLVTAWHQADRLHGPGWLRGWLYARARRRSRRKGRISGVTWECVAAADAATPAAGHRLDGGPVRKDTASVDAECERIRGIFVRLSPPDQEALFLADRHGLDVADLGVVFRCPQWRAQARVQRGRAWLQASFADAQAAHALDRHAAPRLPPGLRTQVLRAGRGGR